MDTNYLIAWLPFDHSATADMLGNEWTAYNSPTIGTTNAVNGNALQLSDGNYVKCADIVVGGQDFTIHGWFYFDSSNGKWARMIEMPETEASDTNNIVFSKYLDGSDFALSVNGNRAFLAGVYDQLFHAAIVYHHADATLKCYINGELKATLSNQTVARTSRKVFLGMSSWSADSPTVGTVDEFMIYDGVALWSEDFTPPTAADYQALAAEGVPATATFDVETRVVNRTDGNYWRYENPGSGDYIFYHDNITTEQVDFDKSVTGVAFWNGDFNDMFNTPAGLKEVWMRFDLWLHEKMDEILGTATIYCGHYSANTGGIVGVKNQPWTGGNDSQDVRRLFVFGDYNYRAFTLPVETLTPVLLHIYSDVRGGTIQVTVGAQTYTYTGNVNNGDDLDTLILYVTTSMYAEGKPRALFSNVVISNLPLTLEEGWHREPVAVELNVKAPDLCVRKNGRNYVIPFCTTNSPPVGSVVARVGGKTVYNPLVATDDENASPLRTRCNGEDRAFSASFD